MARVKCFEGKSVNFLRMTRYLPFTLVRLGAHVWGAWSYLRNADGRRSDVSTRIKSIWPELGPLRTHWFSLSSSIAEAMAKAELAYLHNAAPAKLVRFAETRTAYVNEQAYERALSDGRGVLFVTAHFSCFYCALLGLQKIKDITILQRALPPGDQELRDQVASLGFCNVDVIVNGPNAAFRAIRRLKKGGVVACMGDFYLDESFVIICDFLGRPAVTPAVAALLAVNGNAVVVPNFTTYRHGKYVTEFGEPIDPQHYAAGDTSKQLAQITARINHTLGRFVHSFPGRYEYWRVAGRRWDVAQDLC